MNLVRDAPMIVRKLVNRHPIVKPIVPIHLKRQDRWKYRLPKILGRPNDEVTVQSP